MARDIVISIDAMGGDAGPAAVVGGMVKSARKNEEIRYIVHGDEAVLTPLIDKQKTLDGIVEVRHCPDVIDMTAKPSRAMRSGKGSSMWGTLETVKKGDATAAVSCGNTGALMAISMVQLRKAPGVDRPAIAVLWPSRSEAGHNIVLDVGADIRAEAQDLVQYAIMGTEYARLGLDLPLPRVGLLNVGIEEHKGRVALHEASEMLEAHAAQADAGMNFIGFIEGGDIGRGTVDVIVTDGFTGNVALKTAEGTATLIRGFLREAMEHTILSRIGALFALTSLRRLQKRLDPRRVNGGVFLGLNGAVVKSHGGADATGVSAAIKLAFTLSKNGFTQKVAARVAQRAAPQEDAG